MSGRRDANLRSGDIQESFGLLMLQSVAAVASVPRTEDIGIDAICTLLEESSASRRSLIARESFAVQLKASSVSHLVLALDEVEWLLALELPFFLGVVSLETAELRLYTLNNLVQKLQLTRAAKYPSGVVIEIVPGSYSGPIPSTDVGPPIASWRMSEIKAQRATIVSVLRKWCELEQVNLRLRRLDSGEFHLWQPNHLPTRLGGFYSSTGTVRAIESLKGPVEVLALAGLGSPDREQQWRFWRPLIEFLQLNGQMGPGALAEWDLRAEAYFRSSD